MLRYLDANTLSRRIELFSEVVVSGKLRARTGLGPVQDTKKDRQGPSRQSITEHCTVADSPLEPTAMRQGPMTVREVRSELEQQQHQIWVTKANKRSCCPT